MEPLVYEITINAPKEKVWDTMLSNETYQQWTSVFQEGSNFVGNWEKGSPIKFLSPSDKGMMGMTSRIADNIPYEFISIEHLGEVLDDEEDTTSENAQQWRGAHENYTFTEDNGITTLKIDLIGPNVSQEMRDMFEDTWPKALQKLKEICEQ